MLLSESKQHVGPVFGFSSSSSKEEEEKAWILFFGKSRNQNGFSKVVVLLNTIYVDANVDSMLNFTSPNNYHTSGDDCLLGPHTKIRKSIFGEIRWRTDSHHLKGCGVKSLYFDDINAGTAFLQTITRDTSRQGGQVPGRQAGCLLVALYGSYVDELIVKSGLFLAERKAWEIMDGDTIDALTTVSYFPWRWSQRTYLFIWGCPAVVISFV